MFDDIKPHKTFTEHGINYVSEIVHKDVKSVLELMDADNGATIEYHNIFGFARLVLPSQPGLTIRIEQGFVLSVLQWCKKNDSVYIGNHVYQYELAPGAMDYIRRFTK